jgi:hypothetical protein
VEPNLSQREFDTWRAEDKTFKEQVLMHMAAQVTLNLATHGRVSILEAEQSNWRLRAVSITTWVSAIVAAAVGGLVGWLTKQ